MFVLFPGVSKIPNGIPTSFLREGVLSNKQTYLLRLNGVLSYKQTYLLRLNGVFSYKQTYLLRLNGESCNSLHSLLGGIIRPNLATWEWIHL